MMKPQHRIRVLAFLLGLSLGLWVLLFASAVLGQTARWRWSQSGTTEPDYWTGKINATPFATVPRAAATPEPTPDEYSAVLPDVGVGGDVYTMQGCMATGACSADSNAIIVPTETFTVTATVTPSLTRTFTATPTRTPTITPTATRTPTATVPPTSTPAVPTVTPTLVPPVLLEVTVIIPDGVTYELRRPRRGDTVRLVVPERYALTLNGAPQ